MNGIQNTELNGKIRFVISRYKQEFALVDKQERFKWEAIGWYQQHWNIDAPDFASLLKTAFQKSTVLLASGMYYPLKMIQNFADADQERMRKLFRMLYDENISLASRYQQFRDGCNAFLADVRKQKTGWEKANQHYQDFRAILVYLTFEYPEKYYFYKYSMFTKFAQRVGFVDDTPGSKTQIGRVESYHRLCKIVEAEVRRDTELCSMSAERLHADCYQDGEFHILTMDIIFFGSIYMDAADFDAYLPAQEEENYWPSLEEYDPGITKQMWLDVLEDRSITTPDMLRMLKGMLKLGGESTCAHLAEVYGYTYGHYNAWGSTFGSRVKNHYHCPDCVDRGTDEVERNRVYVIPFVGRNVMENGRDRYSWKLRRELKEALEELDMKIADAPGTDIGLNTILYGPPGTGKTYHTAYYAVAIVEDKPLDMVKKEPYAEVLARYQRYRSQGRIAFTTFHQSYGYEEFIEGIRPMPVDEEQDSTGSIQYSVQPGIFKKFCEQAELPVAVAANTDDLGIRENAAVWKVSLWSTGENEIRTECMKNSHIRIGWDAYGKDITDETDFTADGGRVVLNAFMNKMQIGDIVFSCYSASTIDAIGVVIGDYEWHEEYENLRRLRRVKWIVKDIRENILELNGGTAMTLASVYRLWNISISDVYNLIEKHQPTKAAPARDQGNYVFIIDEINRGNISKILGELITLLEPEKRMGNAEGMQAMLPYSQKLFGVPKNVYILGTMNTADRSIAALDTALRRRFQFREMLPDAKVLDGIMVEDLSVKEMLLTINRRIAVLFDREHTIGHAYFVPLRENPSIDLLGEIFRNRILPLLQEYFYEDYEKIRMVLGDNQKSKDEPKFVEVEKADYMNLFGKTEFDFEGIRTYRINEDAFCDPDAYRLML